MVGYTDEVGVTLPPLHPRCRCAIIYRETKIDALLAPPDRSTAVPNTDPPSKEAVVRAKLEAVRAEEKIKGELIYPLPVIDFSRYTFDAAHTQGDKHPHDVTEEDARRFIKDAYFAIHFKANNSMNYFGREGAAYVQLSKKKIRTAFRAEEYNPKFKRMIEVFENATGKS